MFVVLLMFGFKQWGVFLVVNGKNRMQPTPTGLPKSRIEGWNIV